MDDLNELLTVDNIEVALRNTFAESDNEIKILIEDLIKYTKENDNEELKKFVTGLCFLKKYGYLDIVYDDRQPKEIMNGLGNSCYDGITSTIYMKKGGYTLDEHLSLFTFIHEATHAMHSIMLGGVQPPEFQQIKSDFKKDECLNIYLAGYITNLSKEVLSIVNGGTFSDDNDLDRGIIERLYSSIEMFSGFEDIFDALLDGRLLDGVNITSLTYNDFLRLDPNDADYEEKKEAIVNEYNRVYNQKGLYDLNYKNISYYGDVINGSGHGSLYYSNDKNAFKETIANYMAIKLASEKAPAQYKDLLDNCLNTIFGDTLKNFSSNIIDSFSLNCNNELKGILSNLSSDNVEEFRNLEIANPLMISFGTENVRNDKEFMEEYMKKIDKTNFSRSYITRLVGKELCSDFDFLKDMADDNYEVMQMANKGNLSKEEYTELANYALDKNVFNLYTLKMDKLENGLDSFKELVLKSMEKEPNIFGAINPREIVLQDGGMDAYRELAVEASKKHCSLGNISPTSLNIEKYDPFYYQIVLNSIENNPFEVEYCDFDYLCKNHYKDVCEKALSGCIEKLEDEEDISIENLKVVGLLYSRLGILDISNDDLNVVKDKVFEDIANLKENRKDGKSI